MIKKCTVILGKSMLKRLTEDKRCRISQGFLKAVSLGPYFFVALLHDSANDDDFRGDVEEWSESLAKCFNVGSKEHDDFMVALSKGRRMTAFVNSNVLPENGTRVTVTFWHSGRQKNARKWDLTAIFDEYGGLSFLSRGGTLPDTW